MSLRHLRVVGPNERPPTNEPFQYYIPPEMFTAQFLPAHKDLEALARVFNSLRMEHVNVNRRMTWRFDLSGDGTRIVQSCKMGPKGQLIMLEFGVSDVARPTLFIRIVRFKNVDEPRPVFVALQRFQGGVWCYFESMHAQKPVQNGYRDWQRRFGHIVPNGMTTSPARLADWKQPEFPTRAIRAFVQLFLSNTA